MITLRAYGIAFFASAIFITLVISGLSPGRTRTYQDFNEYHHLRSTYPWLSPRLYALIKRESNRNNLRGYVKQPEAFILAIIDAESSGKKKALGRRVYVALSSGRSGYYRAVGYMQVMPFHHDGDREDLFIPHVNIRIGVRYLAKCFELANGNQTVALKNYNSGPASSVYNWRYILKIRHRHQYSKSLIKQWKHDQATAKLSLPNHSRKSEDIRTVATNQRTDL